MLISGWLGRDELELLTSDDEFSSLEELASELDIASLEEVVSELDITSLEEVVSELTAEELEDVLFRELLEELAKLELPPPQAYKVALVTTNARSLNCFIDGSTLLLFM